MLAILRRADVSYVRHADENRRRGDRRRCDPDGDFPHLNAELRDDGRVVGCEPPPSAVLFVTSITRNQPAMILYRRIGFAFNIDGITLVVGAGG